MTVQQTKVSQVQVQEWRAGGRLGPDSKDFSLFVNTFNHYYLLLLLSLLLLVFLLLANFILRSVGAWRQGPRKMDTWDKPMEGAVEIGKGQQQLRLSSKEAGKKIKTKGRSSLSGKASAYTCFSLNWICPVPVSGLLLLPGLPPWQPPWLTASEANNCSL